MMDNAFGDFTAWLILGVVTSVLVVPVLILVINLVVRLRQGRNVDKLLFWTILTCLPLAALLYFFFTRF